MIRRLDALGTQLQYDPSRAQRGDSADVPHHGHRGMIAGTRKETTTGEDSGSFGEMARCSSLIRGSFPCILSVRSLLETLP